MNDTPDSYFVVGLKLDQCIWYGADARFTTRAERAYNELGRPPWFRVLKKRDHEQFKVAFFVPAKVAEALDAVEPLWREEVVGSSEPPADAEPVLPPQDH